MAGGQRGSGVGVGKKRARCSPCTAPVRSAMVAACALQATTLRPAAAQTPPVETMEPVAEGPSHSKLERAKALQARGVAAFRDGNYTAAIEAFLEADRWVPSAALSFNVARAYDRLGDTGQSLFWYSDYLRRAPEAIDAGQTRGLIAERESKLAAQGTQLLVVRTNPNGAQLSLDGNLVCTTPCATVTNPGVHALAFSVEGRPVLAVRVEVGLPRLTETHFDLPAALSDEPSRAPSRGSALPHTTASATPSDASAVSVPVPLPSHTPEPINGWGWATLAAGGVGVALAGGLEWVRRDAESDAREAQVQVDKQAALDRMDRATVGARIAGAVGGALLLTSGVLWWRDAQDNSSAATTAGVSSWTPILTPEQVGLAFSVVRDVW